MFKQEAEGESSMTISAQVIDTIVEWIDDNLHQPLRIEDIARHAGYSKWHLQRLFMQYKGESPGAIFANASCCWRHGICVNRTSAFMRSACATGLNRSRRSRASLPAPSISRQGRTARKTTVGRTETDNTQAG